MPEGISSMFLASRNSGPPTAAIEGPSGGNLVKTRAGKAKEGLMGGSFKHGRLADVAREAPWQADARETFPFSSSPMVGGLGRNSRFRAALEVLSSPDRQLVLAALDEVSRPMTPKEIEQGLLATGLPRSDRKRLTLALKHFPIVIVGRP